MITETVITAYINRIFQVSLNDDSAEVSEVEFESFELDNETRVAGSSSESVEIEGSTIDVSISVIIMSETGGNISTRDEVSISKNGENVFTYSGRGLMVDTEEEPFLEFRNPWHETSIRNAKDYIKPEEE